MISVKCTYKYSSTPSKDILRWYFGSSTRIYAKHSHIWNGISLLLSHTMSLSIGNEILRWTSNDDGVPNYVQRSISQENFIELDLQALGLLWCHETDSLFYDVNPEINFLRVTKSSVLSSTAPTYHPLGIFSTIVAKCIYRSYGSKGLHGTNQFLRIFIKNGINFLLIYMFSMIGGFTVI